MQTTAYGSWGIADLQNQDNKHAIYTLAGALVYARTGDAALRAKVRDAILAAKRSLDEYVEWQSSNGVLAAGRQLGAYVISADLISLPSYDAVADSEFRSWLGFIQTTDIGTHGRWKNLRYTCENATSNWNTFACASRIAASIYLGDYADVYRASLIIRALLGERSVYPADAPGKNGYFEHTAAYQSSWACNDASWTGDNPSCLKSGVNVDGVLVEDASRGGGCCVLQGDGIMYSWEALQGLFVSVELLYRTGGYGNPYTWSNNALKRTLDFMQRSGWNISSAANFVPWIANARYGTAYPTTTGGNGRIMNWGDWLYVNTNISVAGTVVGGYIVSPNQMMIASYPKVSNGPMDVRNTTGNTTLVSQRVLYAGSSYSELMGFPVSQLTKEYIFPYYNNVAMDSQLRVSNVGGTNTTITVYLAGQKIDSYSLSPGGATRKNYSGKNSGPLKVVSSASNILTTIRVLFNNNSYSELIGFPINGMAQEYWYPIYDDITLDSQLRVSNVGTGTTTITIYAGGVQIDSYSLNAGTASRKNYQQNTGPLHVVSSSEPILSTVRLLYATAGFASFYEITGLPDSQLSTQYFFPWYDGLAGNSQIRFAMP
jgi:hypothetical protein